MAENDWNLADAYYQQLLTVARSAGLDLAENRTKDDLVERLTAADVTRVGHDQWEQDGEPLELEPPQSSSGSDGPSDKTVLYCLTRKETTGDRVERIRSAVESEGFELREAGSENDKYAIVLPAESDEEDEGETDMENMTRDELYEMSKSENIDGRSDMSKGELIAALSE